MAKSNLELYKAYKKSNKDRKARILTLAGYKTESEYLKALGAPFKKTASNKSTPKAGVKNVK